jgi:hypothetical protein
MESGGRIQPAKLTAHLQRYMKCKDLPEHDRRQAQGYLLKQLFLMRPLQEQNKDPAELLQYLTSLAPRQVCQYQVSSPNPPSSLPLDFDRIGTFFCSSRPTISFGSARNASG